MSEGVKTYSVFREAVVHTSVGITPVKLMFRKTLQRN